MGLLTKIFGNRDDQSPEAGEASEERPLERSEERSLERSEERPLERSEERPVERETPDRGPSIRPKQGGSRPASIPSGRLTFAAPSGAPASSPSAGNGPSIARRRQRKDAPASADGGRRRSHEVARGRIARPIVPGLDVPAIPPSVGDESPRDLHASAYAADVPSRAAPTRSAGSRVAAAAGRGTGSSGGASPRPEPEDPDEIDVSDQLEAVDEAEDELDASDDLILEDEEDDEDDEETSTSVAIWGAAAGPAPASSAGAVPEPLVAGPSPGVVHSRQLERTTAVSEPERLDEWRPEADEISAGELSSTEPDPSLDLEWTAMDSEVTSIKRTLVEEGTELTGTLKSSYPVFVNGRFDGHIEAPMISIASTGAIVGTIRATTLRSQGLVAGRIEAGEAYVSGDIRSQTVIRARRLEVKLSSPEKAPLQVTFRTCNPDASELPGLPEAGDTREREPG